MQTRNARPARRNDSRGTRALITAASIAAVLTGWGIFANDNTAAVPATTASTEIAEVALVDDATTTSTQTAVSTTSDQTTQVTTVSTAPQAVTTTQSSR
jgi:hypothetical protein